MTAKSTSLTAWTGCKCNCENIYTVYAATQHIARRQRIVCTKRPDAVGAGFDCKQDDCTQVYKLHRRGLKLACRSIDTGI